MAQIISIATQNPMSLRPIDKLEDAIDSMAKNGFRRVPIIWENNLEGMITVRDVLRIIHNSGLKTLENEIHKHMVTELIYVYRDSDLSQAIQLMFQHDLGALPIISQRDRTLAGIVTERDLVKAFSKNGFADADLMEFITTEPITMPYGTTTIKKVVKTMVEENIRRIILTSKNQVKGILTPTDIIRYISDSKIRDGEVTEDIMKEKANTISSPDVLTVNLNQSVAEVAEILINEGMGGVPVLDDDKKLIGVFTERDILKLIGTYNLI